MILALGDKWTLLICEAGQSLGTVADEVLESGEPVVLVRGARLPSLRSYEAPAPIPNHPVGYFADTMKANEIEESNLLAQESAVGLVE